MKKYPLLFNLLVAFYFLLNAFDTLYAQKDISTHYDGPYIEIIDDSLHFEWIEGGEIYNKVTLNDSEIEFDVPNLPYISVSELNLESDDQIYHKDVSKFVALSDIHGQYDVAYELLMNNKVIDQFGHWNYGDGHLVVVGDILDRGPKVTETLWFFYQLEQEARKVGGKVHVLLGNHELLVLEGNYQYIHPKYRYTMALFKKPLAELLGGTTVLGKWLLSKNICTVINDVVFVHGGFSPEVLATKLSLEKINTIFRKKVLPASMEEIKESELNSLLYFENGPLWYRGYANPSGFSEASADSILQLLDANHIVVGHTSMPRIVSIHNNKIILVDSSIKFGKKGELLIYEEGAFVKGTMNGTRLDMDRKAIKDADSPFEYVYQFNDNDLTIILDTDLGNLLGDNRLKENYQSSTLVAIHNFEFNREWEVRLRTRGNMRKQACFLPPIKIDFSKETLDYLGFSSNDKLKLVLPCDEYPKYQQALYIEHLIYQMYQLVDTLGFRTHLVNVILKDEGKKKYKTQGFFIEDELDFINRTKCKVVDNGIILFDALEREQYLKMMFFQYMIMNTDFADYNKHNVKMIFLEGEERPRAIPYDFDYAGMVDQDYAVPSPKMPISNVREYYFRGRNVTEEEIRSMQEYYSSLRPEFEKLLNGADYLTERTKDAIQKDIDEFYKRLSDEGKWRKRFIDPRKMR